ncbi:hypothetical protein ABIF07_003597 [Bradyrhizobium elkanii]|nr:hypothetical protein [Bradyrhizobium elkanii]
MSAHSVQYQNNSPQTKAPLSGALFWRRGVGEEAPNLYNLRHRDFDCTRFVAAQLSLNFVSLGLSFVAI